MDSALARAMAVPARKSFHGAGPPSGQLLCRLSAAPRCFAAQAPERGNGKSNGQQEPSAASVQHVIFSACVFLLSKPAHRINPPYDFGDSLGDIRRQSASGANGERAILVLTRRLCFAELSSDVVGDETEKRASHGARCTSGQNSEEAPQ